MRSLRAQELVWIAVGLVGLVIFVAVVHAASSLVEQGSLEDLALAADIIIASVGVFGVILLVALWLPAFALQPLQEISAKVRSIGAGSLDERVAPQGMLEIRELGVSINEMVSSLAVREQRLVHRERMASVDMLLAGVAHEIGNPLTFMRINEEVLLQDAKARLQEVPPEGRARVERLVRNAEANLNGFRRLHRLVLVLREMSPATGTPGARVDPNLVVQGTVLLLQHRALHGLTVELDLQASKRVDGHGFELSHVLLNVLLNAADAMAGKGVLRVRTRDETSNILIEIEDTGPGIVPAILPRMFSPHVTTKKGAAGLGLSVARSLLDSLGGKIEGQNLPQGGAVFRITVPSV